MHEIVESIVADHFGVSVEDVRKGGRGQTRAVTDARHFVWFILHTVQGYRGSALAREYNTTVRNIFMSVAQVREGIKLQPFFANNYKVLQYSLRENDIL